MKNWLQAPQKPQKSKFNQTAVRLRLQVSVSDFEVHCRRGHVLDCRSFRPFDNAHERPVFTVLVHQWSMMGGRGKLMEGIARGLASTGYCSVTFDLRGVNRSTGCSTFNGRAEIEDVVDVCDWCLQHLDRVYSIYRV
eukprot:GHVL01009486.1.p1 GENE.GHVL01009486.1~~GHVL01009486.1.p1  ORF type:complete len:137 (+),score=14.42 GHVL01009486.1:19-429(+)